MSKCARRWSIFGYSFGLILSSSLAVWIIYSCPDPSLMNIIMVLINIGLAAVDTGMIVILMNPKPKPKEVILTRGHKISALARITPEM